MAEENDPIPNIPLESESQVPDPSTLPQPPVGGISIPSSKPTSFSASVGANLTQPVKPPMIPTVPGGKAPAPFTFSKAKIPTPPGIKPRTQESLARPIVPVQVDEDAAPLGGSNASPFTAQSSQEPALGNLPTNDIPPIEAPVEEEMVPVVNPLSSLASQQYVPPVEKIELPILKPEQPKTVIRRTPITIDPRIRAEAISSKEQQPVTNNSSDGSALAWTAAVVSFGACAYLALVYLKLI